MPTLVKNGTIASDPYVRAEQPADDTLVPWETASQANDPGSIGVVIGNDAEIEDIAEELTKHPLIAIEFPSFPDGRGLSLAVLLRTRYSYQGEIRAVGEVLPDWTTFMARSGFDAFELANEADAQTALACMGQMSDHYQASVVEPQPAFRRHDFS